MRRAWRNLSSVIAGLACLAVARPCERRQDPAIHEAKQNGRQYCLTLLRLIMDGRVLPSLAWASYGKASKPGHDAERVAWARTRPSVRPRGSGDPDSTLIHLSNSPPSRCARLANAPPPGFLLRRREPPAVEIRHTRKRTEGARDARGPERTPFALKAQSSMLGPTDLDASRHRGLSKSELPQVRQTRWRPARGVS